VKNLVLTLDMCLNKNGLAKACLPACRQSKGVRLSPRPSPTLVGQPSLGRVALFVALQCLIRGLMALPFLLCPSVHDGTLSVCTARLPAQLAAAAAAGFEAVCGEVIAPQPGEPNPLCAIAMAVVDVAFDCHVRPEATTLIPPIIPAASSESRSILSTFIIIRYHY
jgi:hypothetical protein